MNATVLTASHYGVVRFGDLQCEAVVLKGGERGYVRRQLAKLLGFHETHKGGRFARFLADFAPNSLSALEKLVSRFCCPLDGRRSSSRPGSLPTLRRRWSTPPSMARCTRLAWASSPTA